MAKKIRVLVVDDSPLMRRVLKYIIESDSTLEVIGTAEDGQEGISKAEELKPDVITLNINMPRMDGLTALQILVELKIAPVIIVSALTQEDSAIALQALELGAFDYVSKLENGAPSNIERIKNELITKIHLAYLSSKNHRVMKRLSKAPVKEPVGAKKFKVEPTRVKVFYGVAIGVSTGGPKTIYDILPYLPVDVNAAIFLVQHMPPTFTKQFAERLDNYCALRVVEAQDDMDVLPGVVYVGKGGFHLKLKKVDGKVKINLSKTPPHTFMPSVEVMMESVLETFNERTIGILLTGMGDDGANAMVKIKNAGGYTIAESKDTAIIYGMPAKAIERGGASIVLPSYRIA